MERGFVATLTNCGTIRTLDGSPRQGGKLEAFEELVRRHSQLIYPALWHSRRPVEAQDGMQDALLSDPSTCAGFPGPLEVFLLVGEYRQEYAFQRLRGLETK